MASLLEDYMIPQPVPGINGMPDPQELEKAKYLALMRMGMGMMQREPAGRAMSAASGLYMDAEQNARRNALAQADLVMKQHTAMQQQRDDMSKAQLLGSMTRDQLRGMGLPEAVIDTIKYAKDPGARLEAYKSFFEPKVMSEGQSLINPNTGNSSVVMPNKSGVAVPMQGGIPQFGVPVPGLQEANARAAALEQAQKSANSIQTNVPGPNGPMSGYPQNIGMGQPPALAGQQAPQQGQLPPRFNLQNPSSEGLKAIIADLQNPRLEPSAAGVVQGQNPVDVKRFEQGQSAVLEVGKPIFEDQRKQFLAAQEAVRHVANMEKLDKAGVFDGPVGIAAGASVNFLNSFIRSVPGGEDIGQISAKKLSNTDTFESELSKMQQALGKAFPGQQSNYELQVVTNSLPTLMKSPQGRAQIYQAIRGAYEQQSAAYNSMREHMNDPRNNGNLTSWTPPLPPAASITPETVGGASNATTAAFPKGPPVGTLINGKRFKGGNPRDKANWE